MVKILVFNFISFYLLVLYFMKNGVYAQPKIYTYDQVKQLLRDKAVSPSEVFSADSNEDELCKCSGSLPSIASRNDNETFTNPLIIAYTAPSISRCNSVKVYFAYRILMNQTDVNMAICKNGRKSRDMDDCDRSFEDPQLPPSRCPEECLREIRSIPKGEKGEKGDKGDRGERGLIGSVGQRGERGERGETGPSGPRGDKGDKGDKGDRGERGEKGESGSNGSPSDKTGVVGKAPPNNMTVQRTFTDLFVAFHNYTGCSIDQADSWWYEPSYPTLCRNYKQGGTLLRNVNPGTIIKTGFLVVWAYDPGYNHWPALAYRAKENDFIPVLCQVNAYPMFLARLESDYKDMVCPKDVKFVDKDSNFIRNFLIGLASIVGLTGIFGLIYLIHLTYFKREQDIIIDDGVFEDLNDQDVRSLDLGSDTGHLLEQHNEGE
jgi:hypothetical protein